LEDLPLSSIETQSKALQDRITLLTTNGADEPPNQLEPERSSQVHSIDDHRIRELQARIEALEVENEQLLLHKDKVDADRQSNLIRSLEEDRDRISELNAKLTKDRDEAMKAHEATLASLQNLQSLYDTSQKRIDEFENQFTIQLAESQRTAADLNAVLSSVGSARQKLEQENQLLQNEKADLVAQAEDLSAQVDELRVAGQVRTFMSNQCSAKGFLGNNCALRRKA
jgi:chromosome segregation ATPase